MSLSLAWRNLARNRRRSVLTGWAVATAVVLPGWLVGLSYGTYEEMVDKAVHTRIGHIQVMRQGYLEQPEPENAISGGEALAGRIAAVAGVESVTARVLAEGLLTRDGELAAVDLLGVDPVAERAASVVPGRILRGDRAVRWCRENMATARAVLGSDPSLFGRWCQATGRGEFLPAPEPRAVVLGAGVARRLLVTVGDEVLVQVTRAVPGRAEAGEQAGAVAERRLVVTGIVAAGSPEIDERAAYLRAAMLGRMLGTDGPNEIVVLLRTGRRLEELRDEIASLAARHGGLAVHSWPERDPELASFIELAQASRAIFFFLIAFLVVLGVANATLTSVLERRRELGVMLALGLRPGKLVAMIMTEVALLGAGAVGAGALVTAAVEAFGRIHGWPIEWVGWDPDTLESMSVSGEVATTTFPSAMPPLAAVVIVVGVYAMFLLTGLWAADRARRLRPVDAMRRG